MPMVLRITGLVSMKKSKITRVVELGLPGPEVTNV